MDQPQTDTKPKVFLKWGINKTVPSLALNQLAGQDPTNNRTHIVMPHIAPEIIEAAKKWADDLCSKQTKDLKYLIKSLDEVKTILQNSACPTELQNHHEFIAVLLFELNNREDYQGSIKGPFASIVSGCALKDPQMLKLRSAVLRYSFQREYGEVTASKLEQFSNALEFNAKHYISRLLGKSASPRKLISLAYPGAFSGIIPSVRASRLPGNLSTSDIQHTNVSLDKSMADFLIERKIVTFQRTDGRFLGQLHAQNFMQVRWRKELKSFASSLPGLIERDSRTAGDIRKAIELGAKVLGIEKVFGTSLSLIPPWAVITEGVWSKDYRGRKMIWYVAKRVINVAKSSFPNLLTKDGNIKALEAKNILWSALFESQAARALKESGVTVAQALKMHIPEIFGLGPDKILPFELKIIGVKNLNDMRSRLAVELHRLGFGDIETKGSKLYISFSLSNLDPWLNSTDPDIGKKWIEDLRGSLRKYKAESITTALSLMLNGKVENPEILQTFQRQKLFQDLFRHYLNQAPDKKLRVHIRGVVPDAEMLTIRLDSELVDKLYSRWVVDHNRFPKKAQFDKHLAKELNKPRYRFIYDNKLNFSD